MIDILFDTNIIIYLSQSETKYIDFAEKIIDKNVGISVMTYMEVLIGAGQQMDWIKKTLEEKFQIVDINKEISLSTVETLKERNNRNLLDPKFPDIVIAHTALFYNVPLVTNNSKDFKLFKDLELIVP